MDLSGIQLLFDAAAAVSEAVSGSAGSDYVPVNSVPSVGCYTEILTSTQSAVVDDFELSFKLVHTSTPKKRSLEDEPLDLTSHSRRKLSEMHKLPSHCRTEPSQKQTSRSSFCGNAPTQEPHKIKHGSGRTGDRVALNNTFSSSSGAAPPSCETHDSDRTGAKSTSKNTSSLSYSGNATRETYKTTHGSGRSVSRSKFNNISSSSLFGGVLPMREANSSGRSAELDSKSLGIEDDSFVDEYFERFQNSLLNMNDDIVDGDKENQGADNGTSNNPSSDATPFREPPKTTQGFGSSGSRSSLNNMSKSSPPSREAHDSGRGGAGARSTSNNTSSLSSSGDTAQSREQYKTTLGSGRSVSRSKLNNKSFSGDTLPSQEQLKATHHSGSSGSRSSLSNASKSSFSGGAPLSRETNDFGRSGAGARFTSNNTLNLSSGDAAPSRELHKSTHGSGRSVSRSKFNNISSSSLFGGVLPMREANSSGRCAESDSKSVGIEDDSFVDEYFERFQNSLLYDDIVDGDKKNQGADNEASNNTSNLSFSGDTAPLRKPPKTTHGSGSSGSRLSLNNTSKSSFSGGAPPSRETHDSGGRGAGARSTSNNTSSLSSSGDAPPSREPPKATHDSGSSGSRSSLSNTSKSCFSGGAPPSRETGHDSGAGARSTSNNTSSLSSGDATPWRELPKTTYGSGSSGALPSREQLKATHHSGSSGSRSSLSNASKSSFSGGAPPSRETHDSDGRSAGARSTSNNTSSLSSSGDAPPSREPPKATHDSGSSGSRSSLSNTSKSCFSGGAPPSRETGHDSGAGARSTSNNTSSLSSGDATPWRELPKTTYGSGSSGALPSREQLKATHHSGSSGSRSSLSNASKSCFSGGAPPSRETGHDSGAGARSTSNNTSSLSSGDATPWRELPKTTYGSGSSGALPSREQLKATHHSGSSGSRSSLNNASKSCFSGGAPPSRETGHDSGAGARSRSRNGTDGQQKKSNESKRVVTNSDSESDCGDVDDEDQEVRIGDVTLLNDFIVDEYFERFHNITLIINDDVADDEMENQGADNVNELDGPDRTGNTSFSRSGNSDDVQLKDGDLGFDEIEQDSPLKKPMINKRKHAQNSRMRGLEYEKSDGSLVPARTVKPECGCIKLKCSAKYGDSTRKKLLANLLRLSTSGQNQFLSNHMTIRTTARPKVINSRRLFSRSYFLPAVNGRIRVCKEMFMATFDVKDKKLRLLADKQLVGRGISADDLRSGNGIHKTLSAEETDYITQHIKSFPAYTSHYGRERSSKLYLSSDLSVMKMHDLYKIKCVQENKKAVHYTTYRRIFKKMNIGFRKLKVDTCCECDKFAIALKFANGQEKENLEALREAHHDRAQEAYRQKRTDVSYAKTDIRFRTASFDLQKCLPTPHLQCGSAFYLRQLYTLNLTVFSTHNGNNSVDCYLWDESKAKRGSQEIGSCLLKDLESMDERVEEVIFYSDRCAGQNHNIVICMVFLAFIELCCNSGRKLTIQHKFMTSGHSHMEVDSAHAAIEKAKKRCAINIETPRDWAVFIASIHRKIPFRVKEMLQTEFLALKMLASFYVRPKLNVDNEPVKFKRISVFKYTTDHPGIVFYKYDLCAERFESFSMNRNIPVVLPAPINDEPIPLAQEKLEDLKKLMEFVANKAYYETLLKQIVPKKRGRRAKSSQIDHFDNDLEEQDAAET